MKGKHLKENIIKSEYADEKNYADEPFCDDDCVSIEDFLNRPENDEKPGVFKRLLAKYRYLTDKHPLITYFVTCFTIPFLLILYITSSIVLVSIVPTGSMIPAVNPGNYTITDRRAYNDTNLPQRGDIITFTHPERDYYLIKRVIATAGETISFKDDTVYIDGEKLEEDYLKEKYLTVPVKELSYTVPEGYVFVMGDNRDHSIDSRSWDFPYVKNSDIIGKVIFTTNFQKEGTSESNG